MSLKNYIYIVNIHSFDVYLILIISQKLKWSEHLVLYCWHGNIFVDVDTFGVWSLSNKFNLVKKYSDIFSFNYIYMAYYYVYAFGNPGNRVWMD